VVDTCRGRRFDSGKIRICKRGSLSNQAQGEAVSVCSEKVMDSRPGDHLPGTDVLTRCPFFLVHLLQLAQELQRRGARLLTCPIRVRVRVRVRVTPRSASHLSDNG
jgi:hypothetical protein